MTTYIDNNASNITTLQSDLSGNVAALTTYIDNNASNVSTLQTTSAFVDLANTFTNTNRFNGAVELSFNITSDVHAVTKKYVDDKISVDISALIAGAPAALDTLKELADALNSDVSFASKITADLIDVSGNVSILQTFTGNNASNITILQSYVDNNASNITSLTTYVDNNASNITGLTTYVDNNASNITSLTTYVDNNASNITGLTTYVDNNASNITSLTTYVDNNASNITSLTTYVDNNASNITSLQSDLSGNIATLTTYLDNNASNITGLTTYVDNNASNISSLQTVTGGITGDASTLTVSAEAIFSTVAETVGTMSSTTFDYVTDGNTLYSSLSAAGPYSYTITNVPDLSTNSHIFTIIHTAGATNTSTCYADTLTINSVSYTLHWSSGENPSTTMSEVVENDIVTQQIALLPTNFSNNNAISNVAYYRSI